MKKLAIFVILMIFFFSGCSKDVCENSKKKLDEFSFYYGNPGVPVIDLFNTTVGVMVQSITGVKLDIHYTRGGDPATEAAYMISSEVYPDIIYGYTATKDFVDGGALIPLNDLIDRYGGNIKKHYGKTLDLFKDDKGIIYYIGENYAAPGLYTPDSGFRLPIKLLEEAGWPVVRLFSEYVELIKRYVKVHKQENSSIVGFTALANVQGRNTLLPGAAQLMGYPNLGDVYLSRESEPDAQLIVQADFAKKYFKVLNDLWNEGILDKELFSQTEELYYNKIATGQVIGFYDYVYPILEVYSAFERRGNTRDVPVAFPVLFEGIADDFYNTINIRGNMGVGISVKCEDPVGVMTFWNRFLEEDVQRLIYWGIEKMHYYTTREKKMTKSPDQFRTLFRIEDGTMRFTEGFPQWDQTGFFSDGSVVQPERNPVYLRTVAPGYLKNLFKNYGVESMIELFSPPRKLPCGSGDSIFIPPGSPVASVKKKLDRLTILYLEKIITCESRNFGHYWLQFQKDLSKLDIKIYLDYKTEYYRKMKKLME